MNAEGIREFKCMEESVSDNSGAIIRSAGLQKTTYHFGSENAAEFVAKLYRVTSAIRSHTGLYSHVKFALKEKRRIMRMHVLKKGSQNAKYLGL